MDNLADSYWRTPPMARNIATATFCLSIAIHTKLLDGGWFYWEPYLLWQLPPQLWRCVTAFLVTGPGLSILFDTYFIYTYLSTLENGHPRFPRKEDLLWYLIFVCGIILGANYLSANYLTGLGFPLFIPALLIALCYTVTQDQRGMTAQLYFVNIPAQLMPYALMFISFLMYGPGMVILQLHGLFAAHLYDFLTRIWPEFGGGRNLIPTPSFMSRLVQTPRIVQRDYGTAMRSTAQPAGRSTGTSTGASRGPLPDSWETRGRGHRLG